MRKERYKLILRALGIHLILSALVVSLVAFVVLQFWFPYPYRALAGGMHLLWIMVSVDIVCGPLLTAIVFNPKKPRRELVMDLSLVVLLQFAALGYGLYSISLARPVVLAFEIDRMVVVSAAQVEPKKLEQAPMGFRTLSWRGPVLLSTRSPNDSADFFRSVDQSLQGVSPSARPDWWQPYERNVAAVQQRMKPLPALYQRQSSQGQVAIDAAVLRTGLSRKNLYYLPLVSQKSLDQWVVLLNSQGEIAGYAPVGGFEQ